MSGAFWGGLLLGPVILLALIIWSIRRHKDPTCTSSATGPSTS
jgi:hypothetical protein